MRVKQPKVADMTPEELESYEKLKASHYGRVSIGPDGELIGLSILSAHSSDLSNTYGQIAWAIRANPNLSRRMTEIVTLLAAVAVRDEFVWYAHNIEGREFGVTEEEFQRIYRSEPLSLDDPTERAIYQSAVALIDHQDLSDDEYAAVSEVLLPRTIIEIIILIGHYTIRATQMRVFRVDPPPHITPAFS